MKKRYLGVCEKITAFILAFALIFTTVLQFSAEEAKAASITITEAAGWFETAYAEWSPVSGATAYKVYVKEASASDSAYVQLDNELIRKYPNYWRADALGLKAGNYVLKIEAVTGSGSVTATTGTLKVEAHDRSGFAFASGSSAASAGIGAYNNDGTLKSNATVLYVTEENKKTVKMTIKGTEYTGVAAITQAIKDKNSCQPVAIRIIGQVTMDGLVCSDMSSAYAIGVKTASNVTFEGVGDDATLYTAGVAAFQCKSIEVRNLGL
ncbi:MAG: silent information regulator protein Sir2, partial [Lachnospiraceae bacterium]